MLSNKENSSTERKLFYLPIVHTEADMGALSESIKKVYLKKMGLQAWKKKKDVIERFWNDLESAVDNLKLPYSRTKVYQDGLPVSDGGKELEIVKKLASSGSRNHALVKKLVEKGATLVGTESPELLMAEYNLAMKTLNGSQVLEAQEELEASGEQILKKRDNFIAGRINETLKQGEIGVLFIGSLHNVVLMLNSDIEVITPVTSIIRG